MMVFAHFFPKRFCTAWLLGTVVLPMALFYTHVKSPTNWDWTLDIIRFISLPAETEMPSDWVWSMYSLLFKLLAKPTPQGGFSNISGALDAPGLSGISKIATPSFFWSNFPCIFTATPGTQWGGTYLWGPLEHQDSALTQMTSLLWEVTHKYPYNKHSPEQTSFWVTSRKTGAWRPVSWKEENTEFRYSA